MFDNASLASALDLVGPQLRLVRKERGVTLAGLAESTGISKSTLSRLENGQRRPSLELLPPLAQACRVPLDVLVGAPEVGDPAWKIVIPASQSKPRPRTHDGYEWLYVLSGRMRLVLGDRPGERMHVRARSRRPEPSG